jgi:hypothetical protein
VIDVTLQGIAKAVDSTASGRTIVDTVRVLDTVRVVIADTVGVVLPAPNDSRMTATALAVGVVAAIATSVAAWAAMRSAKSSLDQVEVMRQAADEQRKTQEERRIAMDEQLGSAALASGARVDALVQEIFAVRASGNDHLGWLRRLYGVVEGFEPFLRQLAVQSTEGSPLTQSRIVEAQWHYSRAVSALGLLVRQTSEYSPNGKLPETLEERHEAFFGKYLEHLQSTVRVLSQFIV